MTAQTRVTALYVHGNRASRPEDDGPTPMLSMPSVELVEGQGIREDSRYFRPADPGSQRKRQVSVIDEGTIRRHEQRFGPIPLNVVKSQIVLAGNILLPDLLGRELVFEDGARVVLSLARMPCFAMDFIHPGLREAMEGGQQGALAMVTHGGHVAVGQSVELV